MQKCSLCGGKVVNGRCEDCGMPIPPENRYTLRGETVHTHEVNGEKVLHRVRQVPEKKMVYNRTTNPWKPRKKEPLSRRLDGREPGKQGANRWLGWLIAIVVILSFFSEAIASLSS